MSEWFIWNFLPVKNILHKNQKLALLFLKNEPPKYAFLLHREDGGDVKQNAINTAPSFKEYISHFWLHSSVASS